MPINERGFLGQDVECIRVEIVSRHKPYFDLAYDVNGFCQRTKFLLQVHTQDGQEVIAASLLIKMLSDFQAAIIVLERGLVLQGEELLRCALEALFLVQRVADDPSFMATWAKTDEKDRLRMFEAVQADLARLPPAVSASALQEKIDQVRALIETDKIRKLRVADIMNDADVAWLPSLYMLWSLPVHSAPRAVEGYVQEGPPGTGISALKWGPSEDDLDFTLAMGIVVMLATWKPLAKVFSFDVENQVDDLDHRLQAILATRAKS